jgi:hypothetical protein
MLIIIEIKEDLKTGDVAVGIKQQEGTATNREHAYAKAIHVSVLNHMTKELPGIIKAIVAKGN